MPGTARSGPWDLRGDGSGAPATRCGPLGRAHGAGGRGRPDRLPARRRSRVIPGSDARLGLRLGRPNPRLRPPQRRHGRRCGERWMRPAPADALGAHRGEGAQTVYTGARRAHRGGHGRSGRAHHRRGSRGVPAQIRSALRTRWPAGELANEPAAVDRGGRCWPSCSASWAGPTARPHLAGRPRGAAGTSWSTASTSTTTPPTSRRTAAPAGDRRVAWARRPADVVFDGQCLGRRLLWHRLRDHGLVRLWLGGDRAGDRADDEQLSRRAGA